ncbi:FimV/HubP family polar landmark protein [Ideonella margarita]|uniref:FimV/HubP family polar landmark protein n=1 Tax=Ideonella margarita TaxID=2984191 RepID=A0ABU9C875_9BURK
MLSAVAAAALLVVHPTVSALSLGRLNVQSTLGEPLRAEIDITSLSPDEAASLRASVAAPDAFRAAGVDFNQVLQGAQATLARRADGRPYIRLTGDKSVSEPFVDVILDFAWANGRLQRSYTLLIDPPRTAPPPAAATTSPVISAAPAPAAPVVARPPAPVPAPVVASPPPSPPAAAPVAVAPKPAKPAASAPAPAAGADTVKVRAGDTLSSIAAANQRPGVSLDQMLVALYRNNEQAFVNNNMNRLKAGAVLSLPDEQAAAAASQAEARKVIQAHSADFSSFRQRVATAAPQVKTTEPARQATGKVEAAVKDRKADVAPTPDQLKLSRANAASAVPEAKVSKETERKAADARVAELARNVAELKKLQAGTKPVAAASAPSPVVAAAPAPVVPRPTVAAAPVVPPAPAPAKPAPVAAPVAASAAKPAAPVVAAAASAPVAAASAPASAPVAVAASAPVVAASTPVVPASASQPASAASQPKAPAMPPVPAQEESFLDSLTSNPFVLPGAVSLVALLAGLGVMRLRRRGQDNGNETSFIESKLQPDSFFGVSGGQRVDTRDGAGNSSSSSLSYSLSQLDAIGDVDPVAEADVYLAYGRDLQAEEILKEALRSEPNRPAIRTKLLEVYAKRADVRTFESHAMQLQDITGGQGEDWARAQELGRQIDPANSLYGAAGLMEVDIDTSSDAPPDMREGGPNDIPPIEKTQPFEARSTAGPQSDFDVDIDLDAASKLTGLENTRPFTGISGMQDLEGASEPMAFTQAPTPAPAPSPAPAPADDDDIEIDLGLLDDAPAQPAPVAAPAADFDFGDLSLDLDGTPEAAPAANDVPLDADSFNLDLDVPPAPVPTAPVDLDEPTTERGAPMDFAVSGLGEADDDGDPLARKIELADEFRRIGDTEGARDLLEEVVSKSEGATRQRAQAMLDEL